MGRVESNLPFAGPEDAVVHQRREADVVVRLVLVGVLEDVDAWRVAQEAMAALLEAARAKRPIDEDGIQRFELGAMPTARPTRANAPICAE